MKRRHVLENLIAATSLALGRLRARAIALRGASVKRKATLGPGCKVERPWCIRLGDRFVAEGGAYLKVVADGARLEFGNYVFVGRGVEFDVMEEITVGDHTVIAPGCFITDHNHGTSPERRIDEQPCVAAPVAIGSDVWLGANVVVVAGVKIGDGAVVGANAVVTRDVPAMAVVAGVPARVLRYRGGRERAGALRKIN
jgi:acetyltransferase-like isoleucine patch superfamily enzyme